MPVIIFDGGVRHVMDESGQNCRDCGETAEWLLREEGEENG